MEKTQHTYGELNMATELKHFRHKFSNLANNKPLAKLPSGNTKMQQHMVRDVDINTILSKYRKTGVITHIARAKAIYGNFTELKDVADAMNVTAKASQVFDSLPAEIRNEFKNSIPGFFEYIQDPKNRARCEELGIYNKSETPEPSGVVNDASTSDPAPAQPK